jgi:DNA uptake protein ComE-like DNA-binding protein
MLALMLLGLCLVGTAQDGDSDSRGVPKTSATAPPPEDRVDINHATVKELLKVPGMTPGWAERIIRFRPYRSKQELFEWGIVDSTLYDRIRPYVIARQKPLAVGQPR